MAVNLVKGQNVKIDLNELQVVLGWKSDSTDPIDLDLSFFLLSDNEKCPNDDHFVFYGSNLKENDRPYSPCKGVIGSVDDLGDDGEEADGSGEEEADIYLKRLSKNISEVIIVASIYNEEGERKQNFGQARNSYIKIINSENKQELAIYELDEDFSIETAVEFGRIYRKSGNWKFQAIGKGYREGLDFFVKKYGLETI